MQAAAERKDEKRNTARERMSQKHIRGMSFFREGGNTRPSVLPRRAEGTNPGVLPSAPAWDHWALLEGEGASCSYM